MVDRTSPRAHGFTLVEMLVALSILTVGVTTLLLALGDSMSMRRGSDARLKAQESVEDYVHQIAATGLRLRADATSPFDLELQRSDSTTVDGAPGMTMSATMETDDARPDVVLLRVRVAWLEEGETIAEEFLRVVPRQLPLSARIQSFRNEHNLSR
ncbi:MAG: prepilin-type N-terminal cleavage/methylation domain-containing protein [Planctomycetota bacterium]